MTHLGSMKIIMSQISLKYKLMKITLYNFSKNKQPDDYLENLPSPLYFYLSFIFLHTAS